MKEKFTLRHDQEKEGSAISFTPFGQNGRKVKNVAKKIRQFLRLHISSSQYDALLRELTQDLEIHENRIVIKINGI